MNENSSFFKILFRDKKSKARIGEINTSHGKILTPAFVPVGSQATVKSLTPQDLKEIGTQVFFVNTYHLYLRPGADVVEKLGGLHKFMSWDRPIMTDSGGFQVFSLGRGERQLALRSPVENFDSASDSLAKRHTLLNGSHWRSQSEASQNLTGSPRLSLVKIDFNGVTFQSHLDGSKHRFTPEKSMEIQQKLGADMMVAFDECAPCPTTHKYAEMAMKRTHRWSKQCLDYYCTTNSKGRQFLFGVIQGSVYKDLREESAKFISQLTLTGAERFDGLAIGGVAVGESKKEMIQVLNWVMPVLQKEKKQRPVHLLGVGEIDDIFAAVERGVDMMDCVMPTRLGRMGWILTKVKSAKLKVKNFRYDITKSEFMGDKRPPDPECDCYVCKNFSRAYLNHLFRAKELLAYRLATYHNLYFMENLFAKIRGAIKKGGFLKLKKEWLR
ncbi:MAG: tRNA guanosine(34) transglycosylase Tgt, partial [Candidatus Shapirobacteria bacterium]|nr:tRNA guanosine(34) transglycosylase Tgt [Candidatus Shapirobacteria bacterium]